MNITTYDECGDEVLEDEILLGKDKIPGTDLYPQLCSRCHDGGDNE